MTGSLKSLKGKAPQWLLLVFNKMEHINKAQNSDSILVIGSKPLVWF